MGRDKTDLYEDVRSEGESAVERPFPSLSTEGLFADVESRQLLAPLAPFVPASDSVSERRWCCRLRSNPVEGGMATTAEDVELDLS